MLVLYDASTEPDFAPAPPIDEATPEQLAEVTDTFGAAPVTRMPTDRPEPPLSACRCRAGGGRELRVLFYFYAAIALAGAHRACLGEQARARRHVALRHARRVGGLFLLLGSEFLAAMQLFVYGGAMTCSCCSR